MYTLLYILGGLVILVLILSLIAPKTYDVFRTVEIARPKYEVFNYLKSLKNMDEWSPWAKKDPNMEKKFPMNIMSLFKSMDSMVGPDFEEGMASLKEVLEK